MGEVRYLFADRGRDALIEDDTVALQDFWAASNAWAEQELPKLEDLYYDGRFEPVGQCYDGIHKLASLIAGEGQTTAPKSYRSDWDLCLQSLFCLRFRNGYTAMDENLNISFLHELGTALELQANYRRIEHLPESDIRKQVMTDLDLTLAGALVATRAHMTIWASDGPAAFPEHVVREQQRIIERSRESNLADRLGLVALVLGNEILQS